MSEKKSFDQNDYWNWLAKLPADARKKAIKVGDENMRRIKAHLSKKRQGGRVEATA